ncbi:MAG: hypothetical protein AB7E31_04310 [Desulfitobacterium sp.]
MAGEKDRYLTLEEAIHHCENNWMQGCNDCGKMHKQLAEWLKDYAEMVEARNNNRLVLLPSKAYEIIRIIEKAMKFKLYDWQKAYILGVTNYVQPGRVSGKTTAYMLRLCLSEGEPIDLTNHETLLYYLDGSHDTNYLNWFRYHLQDIYLELQMIGGLRLRHIIFNRKRRDIRRDGIDSLRFNMRE